MSQPSAEFDANSVTMPSAQGSPFHDDSYEPSSRATCGLPARASTRFSSMSGLMPAVMRRKTLTTAASSKTTLVLLCSAPDTRGAESIGRVTSGSLLNRRSSTVADESISDSRYLAAEGSYSAS